MLLMRYVFDDLGYRRYEWKLDHHNAPSAAAARRLGFTYEGRFRNAMVYKGRNRDTDWFAMTDADFARLAAGVRRLARPVELRRRAAGSACRCRTTAVARWRRWTSASASSPSPSATSARAGAFFVDGLGWEPALDVPGEVLMFKVADKVVLSLWDADHFEAEVGRRRPGRGCRR